MLLFPDRFVQDIRRLPGASYSFVSHLCSRDGQATRGFLEDVAERVDGAVAQRWRETLTSLDNRRFFQGFSEAATAHRLLESGWQIQDLSWPGPCLAAHDPDGRDFNVLVLGFIRQVRLGPDRAVIERLARAINRVGAQSRVIILVRRWLPHDFDPEPVRRAIDIWLSEVDKGAWDSRYASYDDDHVSLEFALAANKGAKEHGVVMFTMGPFVAQRTIEVLETRMVYELDTYRMGQRQEPVLLSCVSDQPWGLSEGYVREMLYGKARWQATGAPEGMRVGYGPAYAPSLFRDSMYRFVSGVLLSDRDLHEEPAVRSQAFVSPWAETPVAPGALSCAVFGPAEPEDSDEVVLRWFRD